MLTAFYQVYLLIVGICALFCLLVNLFNLGFHMTQGLRSQRMEKQMLWLAHTMSTSSRNSKKSQKFFMRLRMRGMELRALYEAMDRLGWLSPQDIPDTARKPLCISFQSNLYTVSRRNHPQLALLVMLGDRLGMRTEAYRTLLVDCLDQTLPMYLRIVALRGLARQGDKELLLLALRIAGKQNNAYSVKMLTDVLLLYNSDKAALFDELLQYFFGYSENVRCAAISVITMERMAEFAQDMFHIIQEEDMELECRIAAIKYFGTVSFPPVEPTLIHLLVTEDWECAAVAARSLAKYDCAHAEEQLLHALSSSNWYVRYNTAMTIVARRPDLIQRALAHEDRYARDIMSYALDISKGGGN